MEFIIYRNQSFTAFRFDEDILFKPVQKIIAARQAEADKQFDEAAAKQAEADGLKAQYASQLQALKKKRARLCRRQ